MKKIVFAVLAVLGIFLGTVSLVAPADAAKFFQFSEPYTGAG